MALAILVYMIFATVLGITIQISTVGRPKKSMTAPQTAVYTLFAMIHIAAYGYLMTQV